MKQSSSYLRGEGSTTLLYETIGHCINRIAEQYGSNEALVVCHQNIRWSYTEFNERIDKLAAGLLALDVRHGDRVGIWGPNSAEWVLTQIATAKIGAILVCINPAYQLRELEYSLNKVECRALIIAEKFKSSDYLSMLHELAPELNDCAPGDLQAERVPHLNSVIRMGAGNIPGTFNFADVCAMGGAREMKKIEEFNASLDPDDAINIQYTSGTTGTPKGATLTHYNILNNGYMNGEFMQLQPADRLCIPVPLYHCFGMVMSVLACISHGATMVFPSESFEPLATLRAVEEEKCTALQGVPTMFVTQLDHPEFANFKLNSLRTGIMAGATCPVELMKRVIGNMHMDQVLIGYGQTECSPVNHMTLPSDTLEQRTQTVGRAVPHMEIKIVDSQGRVVPVNAQGEVCARGPYVMRGYWNDPAKTAEAIDAAGWLHSGDLGTMDENGFVRITGRIKDMIIRGGENIYPREIEEYLYTHACISEAQVFGVPDEKMGEEICAWIQLKPGVKTTEDDIREFCRGQIAHFKIPVHIRFVNEYPVTVTGKIRKVEMRSYMISKLKDQGSYQ